MLAGVSVTWYTWLEQGRRINASTDVLRAIGRALQLDDAGIDHLTALGQPADGRAGDVGTYGPDDVPSALRRLIDGVRAGARLRSRPTLGVRRVERRPGSVVPADRVAARRLTATCCGCCSPIRRPAS